jgi:hypothetical protein
VPECFVAADPGEFSHMLTILLLVVVILLLLGGIGWGYRGRGPV